MANDILDSVISFDALYESMYKCKRNVSGKPSVIHFYLNGIEETLKLEDQLKSGTYVPRKPKQIVLTYPKYRIASSISYRDRVYLRSMNDNVVYPLMTKSFIPDNMACQTGKGPDKAASRLDQFLRRYYINNGCDGHVLQIDIKHYFQSMNHDKIERLFYEKIPSPIYERVESALRSQVTDVIGYNPGIQTIQIAGLAALNKVDHFIKEKLRLKNYIRYQDDFIIIHDSEEYLKYCLTEINKLLNEDGFTAHPDKTRIYKLSEGIKFLGFTHKLTKTGKIIRIINPNNVKHERKKLRRMVRMAKLGYITKAKVDECYTCWKAHANKGNSYKLIHRMDEYYKHLWEEPLYIGGEK